MFEIKRHLLDSYYYMYHVRLTEAAYMCIVKDIGASLSNLSKLTEAVGYYLAEAACTCIFEVIFLQVIFY